MAAALPYPTLPRLTLRITLKTPGRCLSPTSATDLRNTHPSTVRLLSPQLALQRPSPRCAQGLKAPAPFGARRRTTFYSNPASDKEAFDDASISFRQFTHNLSLFERRRAPFPWRYLTAAYSAAGRLVSCPLTLPVAPRENPLQAPARHQNRFHRPYVNKNGFPDPERLLSTSAPSNCCNRKEPATFPTVLPPWVGFRRSFIPRKAFAL